MTLPDSILSIGNTAFGFCSSLAELTVPASIESIGLAAFKSVNVTSMTFIDKTFDEVSSLSNFPWGITDYSVFRTKSPMLKFDDDNPVFLTEISSLGNAILIDNGIKTDATTWVKTPTEVYLGEEYYDIGDDTFRDCSTLTSINITDNIVGVGERAFQGCENL